MVALINERQSQVCQDPACTYPIQKHPAFLHREVTITDLTSLPEITRVFAGMGEAFLTGVYYIDPKLQVVLETAEKVEEFTQFIKKEAPEIEVYPRNFKSWSREPQ